MLPSSELPFPLKFHQVNELTSRLISSLEYVKRGCEVERVGALDAAQGCQMVDQEMEGARGCQATSEPRVSLSNTSGVT